MKKVLFIFPFLFPLLSFAQKTNVTGKIYDSQSKEPLIAASVRVGKDGVGTNTNADGVFNISLPQGKHRFIFSYIGYISDTLFIDTRTDSMVTCYLKPGAISMPEVTVSAEDPAMWIIREAIKNKKENKKGLISYEYDAYVKQIIKSDEKLASVEE